MHILNPSEGYRIVINLQLFFTESCEEKNLKKTHLRRTMLNFWHFLALFRQQLYGFSFWLQQQKTPPF